MSNAFVLRGAVDDERTAKKVSVDPDTEIGWEAHLQRWSRAEADAEASRVALSGRLEGLLEELRGPLVEVLRQWWTVDPGSIPSLELSFGTADGGQRRETFRNRTVRLGTGASCQVQLPDTEGGDARLAPEQAELRIRNEQPVLVRLSDAAPVLLNGEQLEVHGQSLVEAGDLIELGPYAIEVLSTVEPSPPPPVELNLEEILTLAGENAWRVVGVEGDFWLRIVVKSRALFLRLSSGWVEHAYRRLNLASPSEVRNLNSELDRAVTVFLLHQVAEGLRPALGGSLEIFGPQPLEAFFEGRRTPHSRWRLARFALRLGDDQLEPALLWAADQDEERVRGERIPPDLAFEVPVWGGGVYLPAESLLSIEAGDLLIPDLWFPGGWPMTANAPTELGEVLLELQDHVRKARVRFDGQRFTVALEDDWRFTGGGEFMAAENPTEPLASEDDTQIPEAAKRGGDLEATLDISTQSTASSPSPTSAPDSADSASSAGSASGGDPGEEAARVPPVKIPDDLQMLLAFELDRMPVTVAELKTWEPGVTVALDRRPEEPVRILLHQGGQTRLLGHGRVLIIEDRLGIRIEDWAIQAGD